MGIIEFICNYYRAGVDWEGTGAMFQAFGSTAAILISVYLVNKQNNNQLMIEKSRQDYERQQETNKKYEIVRSTLNQLHGLIVNIAFCIENIDEELKNHNRELTFVVSIGWRINIKQAIKMLDGVSISEIISLDESADILLVLSKSKTALNLIDELDGKSHFGSSKMFPPVEKYVAALLVELRDIADGIEAVKDSYSKKIVNP